MMLWRKRTGSGQCAYTILNTSQCLSRGGLIVLECFLFFVLQLSHRGFSLVEVEGGGYEVRCYILLCVGMQNDEYC